MTKLRSNVIKISNKYHGYIHGLFGMFAFYINDIVANSRNLETLVVALAFSYLPDADHLLQNFVYKRNTNYAKAYRAAWHSGRLRGLIKHVLEKHKDNTGTYSHNILIPLVLSLFYIFLDKIQNPVLGVLLLSWALHYVYDILEDLVYFKKLNPNWFLKYNSQRK